MAAEQVSLYVPQTLHSLFTRVVVTCEQAKISPSFQLGLNKKPLQLQGSCTIRCIIMLPSLLAMLLSKKVGEELSLLESLVVSAVQSGSNHSESEMPKSS